MTQSPEQTESTHVNPTSLPERLAVYVRLPEAEYLGLAKDAFLLGKSVPETLREGYFQGGGGVTILMPKADQRALMVALARIGNNVNQIARRFNAGITKVIPGEFLAVQEELAKLSSTLRHYCVGGNAKVWT